MTKAEIMERVIRGYAHEAFTGEFVGTLDITVMRNRATAGHYGEPVLIPCYPNLEPIISYLRRTRDYEDVRIWELLNNQSFDNDPIMFINHDGVGTVTLVDGIHRLFGRYLLKLPEALAYMVPEDQIVRPAAMFNGKIGEWGKYTFNAMGQMVERNTGKRVYGGPEGSVITSR